MVDRGKGGGGKLPKSHETNQETPRHEQRGGDGTKNKERGRTHGRCVGFEDIGLELPSLPWRGSTFVPACSLSWPSTTTCSPTVRPPEMTVMLPSIKSTWTGRTSARLSALTT